MSRLSLIACCGLALLWASAVDAKITIVADHPTPQGVKVGDPVAVSPNGRYVFEQWYCHPDGCSASNILQVYDLRTGADCFTFGSAGVFTPANELFCCPDSMYPYEEILLLNPVTGKTRVLFSKTKQTAPFLWRSLRSADVNPRTGVIACAAAGVGLVNPKTGTVKVIGEGDEPRWSPDGTLLAYTHNATIKVYDMRKGSTRTLVKGDLIGWLRRDRPQLLIDSQLNGKSGWHRFDVKTGLCRFLAQRKQDVLTKVDLSPSTNYLAESDQHGITFTDTRSGKQQFLTPKLWVNRPYGNWLFWGANDNTLYYRSIGPDTTWRKLTLRITR